MTGYPNCERENADKTAPEWMADVVRQARAARLDILIAGMLKADEDITDDVLWRTRRAQLDELLSASGQAGEAR